MKVGQQIAITALGAVGAVMLGICTYSKVKHGTFDPRPMLRTVNEYFYLKRAVDKVKSEPESERYRAAEGLWNQLVYRKIVDGNDFAKKTAFYEQCGLEVPEVTEDSCHNDSTSQLSCDPQSNAMLQEPEVTEDSCHNDSTSQLGCGTKNNAMIQEPEVTEDSCHDNSTSQLSCDPQSNAMIQEMIEFVKKQPEEDRAGAARYKWENLVDCGIITEDNYDEMKTAIFKECGIEVPESVESGYWSVIMRIDVFCKASIGGDCLPDFNSTSASDQDSCHNDSTSQLSCDPQNNVMLQEMARFVKEQPEENRVAAAYDKWKEMIDGGTITEDARDCYDLKIDFFRMCDVSDDDIETFQKIQRRAAHVREQNRRLHSSLHESTAKNLWGDLMGTKRISKDNYVMMKTEFYELCGLPVPEITENSYETDMPDVPDGDVLAKTCCGAAPYFSSDDEGASDQDSSPDISDNENP